MRDPEDEPRAAGVQSCGGSVSTGAQGGGRGGARTAVPRAQVAQAAQQVARVRLAAQHEAARVLQVAVDGGDDPLQRRLLLER